MLPARKFSLLHQGYTNRDEIGFIDREHLHRNQTDVALRRQNGAVPLKMVAPVIRARMEQPDNFSSRGMPSRDVRPFMPIAVETCEREVVALGCAAMLTGDDVVDVERQRIS